MTLSNRRKNETGDTHHNGSPITVTVGFYEDGRAGEIFAYGYKTGCGHQAERDQTCVLWSKLIQKHGFAIEDFQQFISLDMDGNPITMSGAALLYALDKLVPAKIMQGE